MEVSASVVALVGLFLVLLFMGVPIAISLGLAALLSGFVLLGMNQVIVMISTIVWQTPLSFIMVALPLFIFMGEVVVYGGIGEDLFGVMQKWFGHLPGGLGVVTILSCASFGAVCGLSAATAVTVGTVAIPAMLTRGYNKQLATGAVAAGGTLGILIPPSVNMVIYASIAEESVGKLFIGGIIPGIMLSTIFSIFIICWVSLHPNMAPRTVRVSWKEKLLALRKLLPTVVLAVAVLGSIYAGVVTPTEAAAVGCLGAIVLAIINRKLTFENLRHALMKTAQTSCFIVFILVGAKFFSFMLSWMGAPEWISSTVVALPVPPWVILTLIYLVYAILGCFIDPGSMILITVPIFLPIILALGFDKVWFGIIIVLVSEMGMITPPVAVNLFVVQGISQPYGVTMSDVSKGSLPYVILLFLGLGILTAFPPVILWLPGLMR